VLPTGVGGDAFNASGLRITSIFLGRTATERQRAIFAAEGHSYQPGRLIMPLGRNSKTMALSERERFRSTAC
jgi:hypothetical protein